MNYADTTELLNSDIETYNRVWNVYESFLFGDEFLIAPVLQPNATTVSVFIPPRSGGWVHLVS